MIENLTKTNLTLFSSVIGVSIVKNNNFCSSGQRRLASIHKLLSNSKSPVRNREYLYISTKKRKSN